MLRLGRVALACLSAIVIEQQAPTFRSGVSLVTIDVSVLDADGKPVPGLTPADLDIRLNGRSQPIRGLAYVQARTPESTRPASAPPRAAAPVAPGAPAAIDPSVRRTISNAGAPASVAPAAATAPAAAPAAVAERPEPRVFILVVDDLSFAPQRGRAMFRAAQRFLDRIPPGDPVGFTTTTGIGAVNPTLDREPVRAALAKVVGQFNDPRNIGARGPAAPTNAGSDAPLGISESLDIERGDDSLLKDAIIRECFNGDRRAFDAVSLPQMIAENNCAADVQREARQVAGLTRQNKARQIEGIKSVIQALKGAEGIRHVVLLSDGLPVSREVIDLNPLVRAAAEAGVQLSVLLEEPDISVTDEGRRAASPGTTPQADPGQSRRRREDDMLLVNGLQTMTEMLGGSFHRVVGTPDPFFDRVITSSAAVYRLGVELPAGAKPGDVFEVSVSVSRPGVKARANRFSVAAAAPAAPAVVAPPAAAAPPAPPPMSLDDQLKAALNSGVAAGGVPIRLAAFSRRSTATPGQIDVTIDVAIPSSVAGPLITYLGIVDASGAVRSSKRVLETTGASGYTASFLVPLAPGDYRVRFAAAGASRAVGAIELPVRAVLTAMGPYTVSDVLTWYVDGAGKALLFAMEDVPAAPAVMRASLEIYPPAGTGVEIPMVTWTLTREGQSAPVHEQESAANAGPGLLRADAELPFDALPAGSYVIRATLMIDGKPAGSRAAVVRR